MNTKVEIKVNNKNINIFDHEGKQFIEAKEGSEYTIQIRNFHSNRKLAVVTIDGINVISGQPQGYEKGIGYVISAYGSIEIKGFRKSADEVGAFKFCKKEKSYCNEAGLPGNNGVIGVRFYNEIETYTVYTNEFKGINNDYTWTVCSSDPTLSEPPSVYRCSTNSCSNDSSKPWVKTLSKTTAPEFNLGTTWGNKIEDSAKEVDFKSYNVVSEEVTIYYATRSELEKMGIEFKKVIKINKLPSAFGNFATPPKGWRG